MDLLAPDSRRIIQENSGRARGGEREFPRELNGTLIAQRVLRRETMMSLVRLLGFTTLACGCVTGHYREVATNREVTYVEEKGNSCDHQTHRRNHTLAPARASAPVVTAKAS